MNIKTIDECIGNTPLVRIQRLYKGLNRFVVKLEGNNPAGSVKDRPALSMITRAEERGQIKPGDTLIEATSGNTGIALAMAAAIKGYSMVLIMPDNMSQERRLAMTAYGAQVILTPRSRGMEGCIDLAREMQAQGRGVILDQFANPDNPLAHFEGTGPEIWRDTDGEITHFLASTGTTGTIMGTGRFLKEQNPDIQIIGVRPDSQGGIPGIRAWPQEYLPKIYDPRGLDRTVEVSRLDAEEMTRQLAVQEGIFAGVSSGGNVWAALQVLRDLDDRGIQDALVATVICDRGDRYLSTGVFREE
ncbi:cysteine synthase CysM [Spirochaeta lutea]|uniref:Cysteine synthase n=1 Tax=Spirochaeta lutea TaxID=1480694 RepID=A0A098QV19_9SPIO|nr:cysteine synthase CysM [Spirochaeta lutea]KGE71396.1 cysteine synthase [Spirochaeta lutea]